jgi:acetyl esterase/lipase
MGREGANGAMTDPTEYDNADFIPGGHAYWGRWEEAAATFRKGQPGSRRGLPYGEHPREAFDLFLPDGPEKGIVVFFHGGFWRMGGRELFSHLAAGALARGRACALPSYPLCPEMRIAEITRSIARALPAMAREVAGPILLCGHSAGGHLALRMACPDAGLPEEVAARIAGVLAISPLSDLAPLREMPMNADLRLDPAEARAESPVHHTAPELAVEVLVGADERPAIHDQALWLADAWPRADVTIAGHRHHFDVIEALEDGESPLLRRWLP